MTLCVRNLICKFLSSHFFYFSQNPFPFSLSHVASPTVYVLIKSQLGSTTGFKRFQEIGKGTYVLGLSQLIINQKKNLAQSLWERREGRSSGLYCFSTPSFFVTTNLPILDFARSGRSWPLSIPPRRASEILFWCSRMVVMSSSADGPQRVGRVCPRS